MTGESKRDSFLRGYETYSLYPLIGLGLVFVVAYAVPIVNPNLSPVAQTVFDISLPVIWVIFVVDYILRLSLSRKRWAFIKSNLIDLVAILVPAFRPLRALRIVSVILIATRRFGQSVRHKTTLYVSTIAVFVWIMAGLAITEAERDSPGSTIHSVMDGWWWSFTSLVAGGAGPMYPVTDQGRLIEAAVFMCGLALIGTIGASLAAWFIDKGNAAGKQLVAEEQSVEVTLEDLNMKLDHLTQQVESLAETRGKS